jgi:TPR repeat protein
MELYLMKQISELLRKLHTEESIQSFFLLGYLYEKGEFVPKDYEKSIVFYGRAISLDEPLNDKVAIKYKGAAAYNAWVLHITGHVPLKDAAKVLSYVEIAKEFGDADILYNLGLMYELGNQVVQSYDTAISLYERAYKQNHVDATFMLGVMYANGLGCKQDPAKANELFECAKKYGNVSAKFFLHDDCKSVLPDEDWFLTSDDSSFASRFFDTKSDMSKLKSVLNIYERCSASKQSFSLQKDCGTAASIDPNTLVMLQILSYRGVAQGAYTMCKYTLDALNNYATANAAYLSGLALKLPLYARNSQSVETYVKLYVWAQAWLHRAKSAGIATDVQDLELLNDHKEKVEVICSNVYSKYRYIIVKDDNIWKKIQALVSADQRYRAQQQSILFTIPNQDVRERIRKYIAESNICEYRLWAVCVLDEAELQDLDKQFFDQAVKAKLFDVAKEFLIENEFDVDYILKDLSPDLYKTYEVAELIKGCVSSRTIDLKEISRDEKDLTALQYLQYRELPHQQQLEQDIIEESRPAVAHKITGWFKKLGLAILGMLVSGLVLNKSTNSSNPEPIFSTSLLNNLASLPDANSRETQCLLGGTAVGVAILFSRNRFRNMQPEGIEKPRVKFPKRPSQTY